MPSPDPGALADLVVLTIKTSLGPILERIAAIEASLTRLPVTEAAVTDLRERLVVAETKAARPARETPRDGALTPVLERLASVETTLATRPTIEQTVTELRDRVVAVETKAAMPFVPAIPDVGLTPVLERLASVETTLATIPATEQTLADIRDRVIACETKAATPVLPDQDVRDRLVILEMQTASATEATGDLKARVTAVEARVQDDSVTKALAAVSERVAIVETRAPVPGPQGQDGRDGKDGADGLGFDDLKAVQQDDRSFTIKAIRGDRVQDIGTATFPVQIQRGVYIEGKSYESGDVVTWAGSQWSCNEDTITKPGDGSKAWTLIVKRGRDGRDGRDAPGALPVVSVGRVQ